MISSSNKRWLLGVFFTYYHYLRTIRFDTTKNGHRAACLQVPACGFIMEGTVMLKPVIASIGAMKILGM